MALQNDVSKWVTFSNILTAVRIFLTPVIFITIRYQLWMPAFIIFFIAASTDLLDGYFARMLNQQTLVGKLLDPVADKCLLLTTFGALTQYALPLFVIPSWFLMLSIVREAIIILGSLLLLYRYRDVKVEPMMWGKVTTLLQMLFLMWLFVCFLVGWEPKKTYTVLLIVLAGCSVLSLFQYIKRAVHEILRI